MSITEAEAKMAIDWYIGNVGAVITLKHINAGFLYKDDDDMELALEGDVTEAEKYYRRKWRS